MDLRPYAGRIVQVGFRLVSDISWSSVAQGWYIDDVSFETGRMTFTNPDDLETGYGDWSVEGGMWALGAPSLPEEPLPVSGEKLFGTVLGGNYGFSQDARLVAPEFYVPLTAQAPKFKYSYWHQLAGGDVGQVQVRVDGGQWEDLAGAPIIGASGAWAQRLIDLRHTSDTVCRSVFT